MNTTSRFALMLLIAIAARSHAQQWHHAAGLQTPGPVVWSTIVTGALNRDVATTQYKIVLLPPQFTGPGYKVEVDYSMTRTKTTYPYWNAYARIDAPAADGQVWGRAHHVNFPGTVTGSWSFHGESHASARPHRLRVTFSQPASFPYKFSATVRIRSVPSANIGGALRETPSYVQVGTALDPSWVNGDMWMTVTNHRWMLFVLEAGQQLRVMAKAPLNRNAAGAYAPIYNLNHDLIHTGYVYFPGAGATYDNAVYTNNTGARQWIIFGMRTGGNIPAMELGFYSPQGASPAAGTTIAPPTAAELNPYAAGVRDVKSFKGVAGAKYAMTLPGTGEMLRLHIRIQKTNWMGAGTGALTTVTVYAQDNTVLLTKGVGSDPYGLDNAEAFIEIDRSTVLAKRPARLAFTTQYAPHAITADATRHARTR